jgi:hypothetical protein
MWFREELKSFFEANRRELDVYEWVLITRSDFSWPVEHPPIDLLEPSKIYFMDGEKYGGVSDRYILAHRSSLQEILSIASPIFSSGRALAPVLKSAGTTNPETYILHRLKALNLEKSIVFLPYLAISIRRPTTGTRWSAGEFSSHWSLFIKYPKEAYSVFAVFTTMSARPDWQRYISAGGPIRTPFGLKFMIRLFESLGLLWPTRRPLHRWLFPRLPLPIRQSSSGLESN